MQESLITATRRRLRLSFEWTGRKISRQFHRIERRLGIPIIHHYPHFSILLPADHQLPVHQKYDRLYDRFLPHLAKYLQPGATVIDVGANCGDTLASMFEANRTLTFICVEADDVFFGMLEKNVKRMRDFDPSLSAKLLKSLVGKDVADVVLLGREGTAHAAVRNPAHRGHQSPTPRTLDDLLSEVPMDNLQLLKSDVDGFDYDVINSAMSIVRQHSPMIFFECEYDTLKKKDAFERTIVGLEQEGYHTWVLFDNFGELVLQTTDKDQVLQLLEYVWRMNSNRSTRTLHYFDILAATPKDETLVGKVVEEYLLV